MSTLLHITCPKCQTKLQVKCPDADQASARCQCGHTFAFKVPASARTAPAAAVNQDPFAGLPSSPAPGPSASRSSGPAPTFHQRPQLTNPRAAKRKTKKTKQPAHGYAGSARRASGKPKWILPVAIVSSIVVTVVAGGGIWFALKQGGGGSFLPSSIASVFDSPQAIWDDANENDRRIAEYVDQYLANPAAMKDSEVLANLRAESKHLVARAAVLDPLSPSAAAALTARGEVTGPLTDADKEAIHDKLYERGNNERNFILSAVGTVFAQNDFAREFLRHGHVELTDSEVAAEQVRIDQIRLLRRFNHLAAEIAISEFGKNRPFMSQPEFKEYTDQLYEPIFEPTTAITDELHELASRRYEASDQQVGDEDQYDEILYYVNQARAQVLPHGLSMLQSKATLVEYVGDMRSASGEIERAAAGIKPERLAAADAVKEQQEAEQQQRERERQEKIAAERRAEQEKIDAEKKASQPPPESVASNQPSGPAEAFGGRSSRPPMGQRNPTPRGPPSQIGSRFGPPPGVMEGRIVPMGPGGPSMGPGGRGRPQPPNIDTSTGVTIKMSGAGSIQAGDHTQKLSRALGGAVHWSASGGELTVKLAYTGPLEDVIKHIEFGKVKSTNESTRTIILTPND